MHPIIVPIIPKIIGITIAQQSKKEIISNTSEVTAKCTHCNFRAEYD